MTHSQSQISLATLLLVGALPVALTLAEPASTDFNQRSIDPYEVPNGSVNELFEYLENGPRRMQPRNQDDTVRMFRSLDTAADRIYKANDATTKHRVRAAGIRVMLNSRLEEMGVAKAGNRLRAFLNRAARDPTPELQQFAKRTILEQKVLSWERLNASQRETLLEELRSGLTTEQVDATHVVAIMMLADTVAETPSVPIVVGLIKEVLPSLNSIEDPAIASRVPRLEGLVRRLQLPGNKMEVEGTLLNGDMVDWETYRGKVVLVDYWATWCDPCIDELPNVIAAYEAYRDKGFDILGISLDSEKQTVEQFFSARKLPWQTLFSHDDQANGWNHPMVQKYAINGIPRAILVDQEGKVVSMNLRGNALRQELAKLLGPAEVGQTDQAAAQSDTIADK